MKSPRSGYDDRRLGSFACASKPGMRWAALVRWVNTACLREGAKAFSSDRESAASERVRELRAAVPIERHQTSEVRLICRVTALSALRTARRVTILEAPQGAAREEKTHSRELRRTTKAVMRNRSRRREAPEVSAHRSECQRIAAPPFRGSANANWLRATKAP